MDPILPSNAIEQAGRGAHFPDFVIESFNDLIVKNLRSGRAKVTQDEAIDLILEKTKGQFSRDDVFNEGWLDVEAVFRTFGWKVEYDSPGYCESYSAFYIFEA